MKRPIILILLTLTFGFSATFAQSYQGSKGGLKGASRQNTNPAAKKANPFVRKAPPPVKVEPSGPEKITLPALPTPSTDGSLAGYNLPLETVVKNLATYSRVELNQTLGNPEKSSTVYQLQQQKGGASLGNFSLQPAKNTTSMVWLRDGVAENIQLKRAGFKNHKILYDKGSGSSSGESLIASVDIFQMNSSKNTSVFSSWKFLAETGGLAVSLKLNEETPYSQWIMILNPSKRKFVDIPNPDPIGLATNGKEYIYVYEMSVPFFPTEKGNSFIGYNFALANPLDFVQSDSSVVLFQDTEPVQLGVPFLGGIQVNIVGTDGVSFSSAESNSPLLGAKKNSDSPWEFSVVPEQYTLAQKKKDAKKSNGLSLVKAVFGDKTQFMWMFDNDKNDYFFVVGSFALVLATYAPSPRMIE